MAGKEMLGNLKTQNLVEFALEKVPGFNIDMEAFGEVCGMAGEVFEQ